MTENIAVTEKQLVVFDLAGEHYGVDISSVREIIQMQTVTRVPGSVSFVEGMINLRGIVIPVVDLRKRFGLDSAEHDKDTRIMVMHCKGQDIGMIVDSVTEVLRIQSDSIEPPSSVVTSSDSEYLLGTAKLTDRLVILLDTDRVLSREDIKLIADLASEKEIKDSIDGSGKELRRSSTSSREEVAKSREKVVAKT